MATAEYAPNLTQSTALAATPQPQRVVDKKFMIVMGTLGVAEALRSTTRHLVRKHEKAEGAPWATSVPSPANLIARHAPIYVAEMLVAYEIKKRHYWLAGDKVIRKFWWLYPVAAAAIDFKLAVHTMRLQPPAGCTQEDSCFDCFAKSRGDLPRIALSADANGDHRAAYNRPLLNFSEDASQ